MDFQKWNYIDFKTYLLLYCSLLNNIQNKRDRTLIANSVGKNYLNKHIKQIQFDTGITSRGKINNYIKKNEISEETITSLMIEVKVLLTTQGLFDREQKRFYQSLQKKYFN